MSTLSALSCLKEDWRDGVFVAVAGGGVVGAGLWIPSSCRGLSGSRVVSVGVRALSVACGACRLVPGERGRRGTGEG